ncbi:hypothetical protein ACVWY0_002760 [Arthrobacter sp. UYNi723]
MLRRAENVTYTQERVSFWTGRGRAILTIGKRAFELGKWTREEFQERQNYQLRRPLNITTISSRRYWLFENKMYWENDGLSSDQVYALIVARQQRATQHIERAQATVAMGSTPRNSTARRSIPDDLKQYIWTRDQGLCQGCGSTSELQYDHIIPLAMGGSNNGENLQILCGPCNRSKAAGLTTRR